MIGREVRRVRVEERKCGAVKGANKEKRTQKDKKERRGRGWTRVGTRRETVSEGRVERGGGQRRHERRTNQERRLKGERNKYSRGKWLAQRRSQASEMRKGGNKRQSFRRIAIRRGRMAKNQGVGSKCCEVRVIKAEQVQFFKSEGEVYRRGLVTLKEASWRWRPAQYDASQRGCSWRRALVMRRRPQARVHRVI